MILAWLAFLISSAYGQILILKKDYPIKERPHVSVTTFIHPDKFQGYHTVVVEKFRKQKVIFFKSVHPNRPSIHHQYAIYWALCELGPGASQSDTSSEEPFDDACRFDLFSIIEKNDDEQEIE